MFGKINFDKLILNKNVNKLFKLLQKPLMSLEDLEFRVQVVNALVSIGDKRAIDPIKEALMEIKSKSALEQNIPLNNYIEAGDVGSIYKRGMWIISEREIINALNELEHKTDKTDF